jgi:hypothetical protein
MAYAEKTEVAFEKSIGEIVGLVRKHGAEQIGQMENPGDFTIGFRLADRLMRFRIVFPSINDMPTHDGRRQPLSAAQRRERLEQWKRQRARALMLVIRAKLESVESGIETLEEAFLANVVMADGKTMYERVAGPIALEYETGRPALLLTDQAGD